VLAHIEIGNTLRNVELTTEEQLLKYIQYNLEIMTWGQSSQRYIAEALVDWVYQQFGYHEVLEARYLLVMRIVTKLQRDVWTPEFLAKVLVFIPNLFGMLNEILLSEQCDLF